MKISKFFLLALVAVFAWACQNGGSNIEDNAPEFEYFSERFADLRVLRYQVPGFDDLPLQQKKLLYYLSEAALSGRDMIWDQNYKHNLAIRKTLEAIINAGPDESGSGEWEDFMVYAKRVFFSNGIHHHYANDKIFPEFSPEYFATLVGQANPEDLPLDKGESPADLADRLTPIMFNADIAPKKVDKRAGVDWVAESAVNFYEGVTQPEVEAYYRAQIDPNDKTPVSYGLNTKVVKENGQVTEKVWKIDGMYGAAIERVVYWLEKAATVAENEQQRKALELLVDYYRSGDLATFDEYSIAWVADTNSVVDVINGFIEVYNDPIGYKGSYESVVSIRDPEASRRIEAISKEAQWFEDNMPYDPAHKKDKVTGISAKVINVVMESGDASPSTPIGINLPNANWIRKDHGSKSVNLANIVQAYEEASKASGFLEEFAYDEAEIERAREYGSLADALHTDMHEVIGHASGRLEDGVGTPKETLRNYASTIEEGRADLVALFYGMDIKLVEIGLMPNLDVGKTMYDDFIRNGMMTQLRRIRPGNDIEEAHMRNRAWISYWVYEKGRDEGVITKETKEGKTYFVIQDYEKLRDLFGELLKEVQRIKSQGDYTAAQNLVETYGVKVDPELHGEVLERFASLDIAPYSGFINPRLDAVEENGEITDVKLSYPNDFVQQMLRYGRDYAFLPVEN